MLSDLKSKHTTKQINKIGLLQINTVRLTTNEVFTFYILFVQVQVFKLKSLFYVPSK
jgi:hypothetical protein